MRNVIYLMLLLAQPVWATDAYLCIVDLSAGFKHYPNTNSWSSVDFNSGTKYLIKNYKPTELEEMIIEIEKQSERDTVTKRVSAIKWGLYTFGEDYPMAGCSGESIPNNCSGINIEFTMDSESGRFQAYQHGDYTQSDKQNKEDKELLLKHNVEFSGELRSVAVSIGKCSPL